MRIRLLWPKFNNFPKFSILNIAFLTTHDLFILKDNSIMSLEFVEVIKVGVNGSRGEIIMVPKWFYFTSSKLGKKIKVLDTHFCFIMLFCVCMWVCVCVCVCERENACLYLNVCVSLCLCLSEWWNWWICHYYYSSITFFQGKNVKTFGILSLSFVLYI